MPIASNACTIARMDKDQDPPAFDPTRLLDGWQPAAAPLRPELDLSGLLTGLQGVASAPREARLDPERVARLKQRGFEMNDIEDIEVPEIRLPVVEDAPPVDAAGLAQALRATVALAQSQSEPPRDSPDLDLPAAPGPAPEPRLLARWQPGAWVGVRRRALGASTELLNTPDGPLVENHAPQWLLAVWAPQGLEQPLLGRWPEQALLCAAEQPELAARQLLQGLPDEALLWLSELEVDWALLADLVLHHDAALKPYQVQALRALAEAERLASFEQLNRSYEAAAECRPLRRRGRK